MVVHMDDILVASKDAAKCEAWQPNSPFKDLGEAMFHTNDVDATSRVDYQIKSCMIVNQRVCTKTMLMT